MDTEKTPFRPPYMSFQTFWRFIDELGSKPVPPQIDRSLMGSKSGTDQASLTATLTAFGLIGPGGAVEPPLRALTQADAAARRAMLAALLRDYYPDAIRVSEDGGTEQQLNEAFRDAFGLAAAETRRKCVTFFLHAAREAQVPLSAYFPSTRGGSGAPGVAKAKAKVKRKTAGPAGGSATETDTAQGTRTVTGDTYSVSLTSGGEVSVVVNVNLFTLSTADRTFVLDLVDKLKGYHQDDTGAAAEGGAS